MAGNDSPRPGTEWIEETALVGKTLETERRDVLFEVKKFRPQDTRIRLKIISFVLFACFAGKALLNDRPENFP